jgi:hypothetical protein
VKNECIQGSGEEAALGTSVQDLGDGLKSWQRGQTDICTDREAYSPHMVDLPASKQPIAKRSTGQNNGANACRLRRVMLGVGANRASQARSVSAVQRPAKSVWRLDVAVRARA